jgi:hypothetical protein
MFQNKVFVVEHKNDLLSVVHNNRKYIMGTHRYEIADSIRKRLGYSADIHLARKNIYDVTNDVNKGLRSLGMDVNVKKMTIDTHAELTVVNQETQTIFYNVEEIDVEDFLLYPIQKNIGIVMPYELTKDNGYIISYWSNIVDPCEDTDSFRKNLKL